MSTTEANSVIVEHDAHSAASGIYVTPSHEFNRRPSRIDVVVQALPPAYDAIGEYSACLSKALSKHCQVRILTSFDCYADRVANCEVVPCFSFGGGNGFHGLLHELVKTQSDAVVLQYNPFAWGNRGYAPQLIWTLRKLKEYRPDLMVATMFHETFVPSEGVRFRVMRLWQVPQYRRLISLSDLAFFSVGVWADNQRQHSDCSFHLPVGSNLPTSVATPSNTRFRFGIQDDALVLGTFGGAHSSRMFDWVGAAVRHVSSVVHDRPVVLLHVGGDSARVAELLGDNIALVQTGRVSAADAANTIACMDIMLNPFVDGVSTRRGSVISALQSGIAVATTLGHHTEAMWSSPDASGVTLSPVDSIDTWLSAVESLSLDPNRRTEAGRNNLRFFERNFSWPVIASQMIQHMAAVDGAMDC